jgi:hypothetical protein
VALPVLGFAPWLLVAAWASAVLRASRTSDLHLS